MGRSIFPVSVRLPMDLYKRVLDDAARNERSISSQIIYLIRVAYGAGKGDKEAAAGDTPA